MAAYPAPWYEADQETDSLVRSNQTQEAGILTILVLRTHS